MQRYSYSKLLALVRLQWNTKKMKNNKNFRIMWGVEGFLFSGPRWQRRQDSKLEVLCFSFPTFSRQKKKNGNEEGEVPGIDHGDHRRRSKPSQSRGLIGDNFRYCLSAPIFSAFSDSASSFKWFFKQVLQRLLLQKEWKKFIYFL